MWPYLTDDIQRKLFAAAEESAPNEAVGYLEGGIESLDQTCLLFEGLVHLVNRAPDPTANFVLESDQIRCLREAREAGRFLSLWHSHPHGTPILSKEDRLVMSVLRIPMLVVSLPLKVMVMFTYLAPSPTSIHQPIVEWGRWKQTDLAELKEEPRGRQHDLSIA